MNTRAMALIVLALILAFVRLSSQSLQRTTLHPGRSSVSSIGRFHWTFGQIESVASSNGTIQLTRGFEQNYRDRRTTATLYTESASGYPGDTITSAVRLRDLSIVNGTIPNALEIEITVNVTLLAPVSYGTNTTVLGDVIGDSTRVFRFRSVVSPVTTDQELARIRYVAGLGDDSTTVFRITDVKPVGPQIGILRKHGEFHLLGICREGGPRLVDPRRIVEVGEVLPMPVVDDATITIELRTPSNVSMRLVGLDGRLVADVLDESLSPGLYTVGVPLRESSSGAYLLVVDAGGEILTRMIVVRH